MPIERGAYRRLLLPLAVASIVIASIIALNCQSRSHPSEYVTFGEALYEVDRESAGWPFRHWQKTSASVIDPRFDYLGTSPPPIIESPKGLNDRMMYLVLNMMIAVTVAPSTALVVDCWQRHVARKLQFSIRSLLATMLVISVCLAVVAEFRISLVTLLLVPAVIGLGCVPAAVGIQAYNVARPKIQKRLP
ncbi:MAG: hypothetical protein KDA41_18475 [Planctomycetales bacterium]|nr:hypothetical protein [Planctomycetales bacterium]